MKTKIKVPGELLLILVLVINSMGVQFMTKSGFGISAISSVPYVLSNIFPSISFGAWNYTFQTLLVITLVALSRRFTPSYIISFAAGVVFGKMLDIHALWMAFLPDTIAFRFVYFGMGMLSLGFGIALANKCMLPIIPTDMFPRDFSEIANKKYKIVKTVFDLACLTATVVISMTFMGRCIGIGAGTVVCSMFTGKFVSIFQGEFEKHFEVYRAVEISFNKRGKIAAN